VPSNVANLKGSILDKKQGEGNLGLGMAGLAF